MISLSDFQDIPADKDAADPTFLWLDEDLYLPEDNDPPKITFLRTMWDKGDPENGVPPLYKGIIFHGAPTRQMWSDLQDIYEVTGFWVEVAVREYSAN